MNKVFEITLPIRTVSEANSSEHWSKKSRRHRIQKKTIWAALHQKRPQIEIPIEFTLTRVAPRSIDFDNLVSSFKWIADACAEYVHPGLQAGRADSDKNITFKYAQEKSTPKTYAVRIEIYC